MTVAPERPCPPAPAEHTSLLALAETVFQTMPGYRPEILGGLLVVTPPPDGSHQQSLTDLTFAFAELHGDESKVLQGVGIWLPTGADDYAIPDLAVVDADFNEHVTAYNCLDPAVFRAVVEVTSSNWRTDLFTKPDSYAAAGVPVYVIGDREHGEAVVYTDPHDGAYRTRSVYGKGQSFVLPESIGVKVELRAETLLLG